MIVMMKLMIHLISIVMIIFKIHVCSALINLLFVL